jgi:hypothetical protein
VHIGAAQGASALGTAQRRGDGVAPRIDQNLQDAKLARLVQQHRDQLRRFSASTAARDGGELHASG